MATGPDRYSVIVSSIQDHGDTTISVPRLSTLLGVKATTLNARFRRLQTPVRTIGRVNFVPLQLAVELAGVHKYALMGWPTVQQASRLTAVKGCTIKAKCEKGLVEGHIDLTKRLRINPAALEALRPSGRGKPCAQECVTATVTPGGHATGLPEKHNGLRPERGRVLKPPPRAPGITDSPRSVQHPGQVRPAARPFVLAPARPFEIKLITAADYGLSESGFQPGEQQPRAAGGQRRAPGRLWYDPDRPFSLSECALGKAVQYGEYTGTIVGILDEPFSPKIKVSFPEHRHPLMQEVLLAVDKRRG